MRNNLHPPTTPSADLLAANARLLARRKRQGAAMVWQELGAVEG
jgi:hypothetical protein